MNSGRDLGAQMRARRQQLGLTIEEAARQAGVGSESWRRYENNGTIRADKRRGVTRALRWASLPGPDSKAQQEAANASEEPAPSPSWLDQPVATFDRSYSIWLERELGKPAAYCFAAGIDMLRDYLDQDLAELAGMPRGTHVGELRGSWLDGSLPPVWQTRYDYELLFRLRVVAEEMRTRMVHPGYDGDENLIRCVADDLVLHLALGLGQVSAELADSNAADDWDEWLLELNGEDDEVIPLLFSQTSFPAPDAPRHIDNWFVPAYWQTEVDDDADTSPELPTLP